MQPDCGCVVTVVPTFREMSMRRMLLLAGCTLMLAGLAACHQEGPAEKAGSSLDNAGNKVQDTLDPPQGPGQAAGRKVDRALGN
ncbi:hypothetical protein [Rhodopila sp.]|uniref:hypothetical protein n=1 Tax=Rhodopila sp. TaxID=2480087 RepID=UPI003D11B842